ncbi:MAG TPA: hypothetical protein VIX80_00410 [Candidatus Kapabacteria bacterium]
MNNPDRDNDLSLDPEEENLDGLLDEEVKELEPNEIIELGDDSSLDDGLDIPGSELDDEMEKIGEEDEENNYYSLGGDDHDDLEEDRSMD